jgi:hypothetical protein
LGLLCRLWGTLVSLWPLCLLRLLPWLLQLGDDPALLIKGTGWARVLSCLRLRSLEQLWLLRLLLFLFLPPLWPGLRVPLSQLLKNGPHGLCEVRVQGRAQERLCPCRLLCLRCPQLRGTLRGAWPLLLLGLLCRLWGTLLSLWLLFLSRLLHRRLQLGDHPALLIKDIGGGRVLLFLLRLLGRLIPFSDDPARPIKVNRRKVPFDSIAPRLGAHPALLNDAGRGWLLRCPRLRSALRSV